MTIQRVDRWTLEVREPNRKLVVPVEASADGGILSIYLERMGRWEPSGGELTPEERTRVRSELERNYAGSGTQLEFDPTR